MPEPLEDFIIRQKPTSERPLAGHTVLVVEDSRFASEALRLLCLRSGARVRRADSLASAARHLATYRPNVAVVDLGLPDGSGKALIEELKSAQPPVPVVLGTSGDPGAERAATEAGADGFLEKPLKSVAAFQAAVLGRMPSNGPRPVLLVHRADDIDPDELALQDDIAHVVEVLEDGPDAGKRAYIAQFLSTLARSAGDQRLEQAARRLARASSGEWTQAALSDIRALLEQRRVPKAVV